MDKQRTKDERELNYFNKPDNLIFYYLLHTIFDFNYKLNTYIGEGGTYCHWSFVLRCISFLTGRLTGIQVHQSPLWEMAAS